MKDLLNNLDMRKVSIIYELSKNQGLVHLKDLATLLNLNERTLLSTIDEINYDAKIYNIDLNIEKSQKLNLILEVNADFSVDYFKYIYIKRSILYRLIDSIFRNNYENIRKTAKNLHISLSSIYRQLPNLKKLLNKFDLDFCGQNKFPIMGKEYQIRYFFLKFYWCSNRIFEWPFDEELKKESNEIYYNLYVGRFNTNNIFLKEKMILWIAINLIRDKEGYVLDDIGNMNKFFDNNKNFLEFKEIMLSAYEFNFDSKNKNLIHNEIVLFYSLMVSEEMYSEKLDYLSSFFTIGGEQSICEEAAYLFINKLNKFLNQYITNKEYTEMFCKIFCANLVSYFFYEDTTFFYNLREIDFLKDNYNDLINIFDIFIKEVFKNNSKFEKFFKNKYLYYKYLYIIISTLDVNYFYNEIKIALLISSRNKPRKLLENKIRALTILPITFVDKIYDDVDLVISDTLIYIEEKKCFIINNTAYNWEWERLKNSLDKMRRLKIKNKD